MIPNNCSGSKFSHPSQKTTISLDAVYRFFQSFIPNDVKMNTLTLEDDLCKAMTHTAWVPRMVQNQSIDLQSIPFHQHYVDYILEQAIITICASEQNKNMSSLIPILRSVKWEAESLLKKWSAGKEPLTNDIARSDFFSCIETFRLLLGVLSQEIYEIARTERISLKVFEKYFQSLFPLIALDPMSDSFQENDFYEPDYMTNKESEISQALLPVEEAIKILRKDSIISASDFDRFSQDINKQRTEIQTFLKLPKLQPNISRIENDKNIYKALKTIYNNVVENILSDIPECKSLDILNERLAICAEEKKQFDVVDHNQPRKSQSKKIVWHKLISNTSDKKISDDTSRYDASDANSIQNRLSEKNDVIILGSPPSQIQTCNYFLKIVISAVFFLGSSVLDCYCFSTLAESSHAKSIFTSPELYVGCVSVVFGCVLIAFSLKKLLTRNKANKLQEAEIGEKSPMGLSSSISLQRNVSCT